MAHEHLLSDFLEALKNAGAALGPAALGSLVAQIHEKGLGWRDRLFGYVAGICTSYYVTLGVAAWFGLDQFVGQAVGFVLGMIAFKSTPRFISAASDLVGSLPGMLRDGISGVPAALREWISNRKDQA